MRTSGGLDLCYNEQAAVDNVSMLIVTSFVTQAGNDSQQVDPMLAALERHQDQLGRPSRFLADPGYISAADVDDCEQAGITPLIAMKRAQQREPVLERFTEPPPLSVEADAVAPWRNDSRPVAVEPIMAYPNRQSNPCSALSTIAMKFHQFLVHGVKHMGHEWNSGALARSIK